MYLMSQHGRRRRLCLYLLSCPRVVLVGPSRPNTAPSPLVCRFWREFVQEQHVPEVASRAYKLFSELYAPVVRGTLGLCGAAWAASGAWAFLKAVQNMGLTAIIGSKLPWTRRRRS
jgi:hypothetical protein